MANPSISFPDWMVDEIRRRKPEWMPRSVYVRQALQARFNDEDAGEWTDPEIEEPDGDDPAPEEVEA